MVLHYLLNISGGKQFLKDEWEAIVVGLKVIGLMIYIAIRGVSYED